MRPCPNPSVCGVTNHRDGTICKSTTGGSGKTISVDSLELGLNNRHAYRLGIDVLNETSQELGEARASAMIDALKDGRIKVIEDPEMPNVFHFRTQDEASVASMLKGEQVFTKSRDLDNLISVDRKLPSGRPISEIKQHDPDSVKGINHYQPYRSVNPLRLQEGDVIAIMGSNRVKVLDVGPNVDNSLNISVLTRRANGTLRTYLINKNASVTECRYVEPKRGISKLLSRFIK